MSGRRGTGADGRSSGEGPHGRMSGGHDTGASEDAVDTKPDAGRGEVHSPGGFEGPSEAGAARETRERRGRGRREGRRRGRGPEELMVPEADFRSYYGRQVIHTPVWEVPDVPGYLYLGGMAGAASLMGALGDATGRPALRRAGRLAASGGSVLSVIALVHDLGHPTRFLNMLRVFKVTSPLSVGSWILSPFSTFAAVAAVDELSDQLLPLARRVVGTRLTGVAAAVLPVAGHASGAASAVLGPALSTYTAVLIADTAVPAWHSVYPELPFVFASSGVASAGGIAMVTSPLAQAGPARRMGVVGATAELALTERMEHRIGMIGEAYKTGRAKTLLRVARIATIAGGLGALAAELPVWGPASGRGGSSRRSRWRRAVSVGAGVALNAGAGFTRFGVYEAGMISARDPKYTVVPQRERLDARRAAAAAAAAPTP